MNMKDIFIRGLPDSTVNKIDQKINRINSANPSHKKLTRNSFIKMILKNESDFEIENYQRTQFEISLKHVERLHEIEINLMKHIIYCFATGDVTDAINTVDALNREEKSNE